MSASISRRSSSFVLLLKIVAASTRPAPWIAFTSQKVRNSIFPSAHSRFTWSIVAWCARKPSRRWIMRTDFARPCRFTAQSNAESPPPTSNTRRPANCFGSTTLSYIPLSSQTS